MCVPGTENDVLVTVTNEERTSRLVRLSSATTESFVQDCCVVSERDEVDRAAETLPGSEGSASVVTS